MTQLTPDLLRQIMQCPADRAEECFPAMVDAMRQFRINTPARIVCFLTQVKWESGGLVYFAELASGNAYNGRADLGNTHTGDGPRYKGSGPIQVTGRSNFQSAQQALNSAGIDIDIVSNPDLARTVKYGFWISCWWWNAHGGNDVAEQAPLDWATVRCGRLVNRGNADSPYKAQDEAQRLAAFAHVQQFGQLELPDGTIPPAPPAPPAPTDWFDTVDKNELSDLIDARLEAARGDIAAAVLGAHLNPKWKGTDPDATVTVGALLSGLSLKTDATWKRTADVKASLSLLAGAIKAAVTPAVKR